MKSRNYKPTAGGKEKWVVAAPRNCKPTAGGQEKYVAATAAKLQAFASKVKRKDAMRPPRSGETTSPLAGGEEKYVAAIAAKLQAHGLRPLAEIGF